MAWNLRNHTLPTQGYTGTRASPTAIAAAIAVHVAVAGVILMMPPEMIEKLKPDIIWAYPVPPEPVPPEPEVQPQQKESHPLQRQTADPDTMTKTDVVTATDNHNDANVLNGGNATQQETVILKAVEPVFVQAIPDPKRMRDFQPAYPGSMIRSQIEGFATVRVFINANGRVETVELVDTNNAAFWKTTREQALRHWRFRPATRDGVPVTSERVMTVRFRLSDLD